MSTRLRCKNAIWKFQCDRILIWDFQNDQQKISKHKNNMLFHFHRQQFENRVL